jgi:hypothetical protein
MTGPPRRHWKTARKRLLFERRCQNNLKPFLVSIVGGGGGGKKTTATPARAPPSLVFGHCADTSRRQAAARIPGERWATEVRRVRFVVPEGTGEDINDIGVVIGATTGIALTAVGNAKS